MKKVILTLVALTSVHASEIDPFVGRDIQLTDALELVNTKANTLLLDALDKTNAKEKGCEEKILYKQLRKKFRNHYTSEFSKWVVKTDEIEKITTKTSQSIYRDFKWYQAIVPGLIAKINDPAGQTMRVNGVLIGTDKFEHFLGSGFNYFKKHFIKGRPLKEAMEIGLSAETGLLGAYTTGVMSYADLVANFNGMRFWNRMLAKNLDPLTNEEVLPYLTCNEGKWEQVRPIDFSIYIDHAWDEAINCSWFRTERMVEKVKEQLEQYSQDAGHEVTCPMNDEKLIRDGQKYSKLPLKIINLRGHQSIKENR